jgi:molybdopterin molybdotransferase
LPFATAVLGRGFTTKSGLTRFLPAVLGGPPEEPSVELVAWQGSGDVAAIARANCFLRVPPDRDKFEAGERVTVLLR